MKYLFVLLSVVYRLFSPALLYAQPSVPDPVMPGGRHALVIGNGEYRDISIAAPVENARLMADVLRSKSFKVTYLENATVKEMKAAMRSFGNRLSASVAVVYYAGHSITSNGKIFLVPVTAKLDSVSALDYECVELSYLTKKIDRNPMNMVVLETGTDRPFQQLWPHFQETHEVVFPAMENTLVVVSTDLTQRIGQNQISQGVFTREFIRQMQVEGVPAHFALKKTVSEVEVSSGGLQKPVISGNAFAFFRFSPDLAATVAGKGVRLAPEEK